MHNLIEIQKGADQLSVEERAGLVTHLLATLPFPPLNPGDEELDRREQEMDSGAVLPISHARFLAEIGRS